MLSAQTQTAVPVSPAPVRIELALTDVVAGLSVLISSVSVVLWRRAIATLRNLNDQAPERLLAPKTIQPTPAAVIHATDPSGLPV